MDAKKTGRIVRNMIILQIVAMAAVAAFFFPVVLFLLIPLHLPSWIEMPLGWIGSTLLYSAVIVLVAWRLNRKRRRYF